MKLLSTRLFPTSKQKKGVVFFLCPHGITIDRAAFSIKRVTRQGYDVYAYDFTKDALDSGDPSILPKLIEVTRKSIKGVIEGLPKSTEIGMFGSSLGSFIAYNLLDIDGLQWVVMSTGGDMAHAVWAMDDTRTSLESRGVKLEEVEKRWSSLQSPTWKFSKPPTVLLISATRDKVATLKHAKIGHDYMLSQGVNSHFAVQKGLNHKSALLHNFISVGRLINRVKKLQITK